MSPQELPTASATVEQLAAVASQAQGEFIKAIRSMMDEREMNIAGLAALIKMPAKHVSKRLHSPKDLTIGEFGVIAAALCFNVDIKVVPTVASTKKAPSSEEQRFDMDAIFRDSL